MLIQSMYLTKYIAEKKSKDLSKVEYSPIVKKLYRYSGKIWIQKNIRKGLIFEN